MLSRLGWFHRDCRIYINETIQGKKARSVFFFSSTAAMDYLYIHAVSQLSWILNKAEGSKYSKGFKIRSGDGPKKLDNKYSILRGKMIMLLSNMKMWV